MFSTFADIGETIVSFLTKIVNLVGADAVFFIALAVEALLVIFFLVKSLFSYEAQLNRTLEKLNYWLFEHKVVNENNIKDLNVFIKTKSPKRLTYHWQQYILFREGPPSSYLSVDNLIEKPLKTSSYNSNIKNLTLFSSVWALVVAMFFVVAYSNSANMTVLSSNAVIIALLVPIFVMMIAVAFVAYLRARKNALLNALYQNCALFGRFMDNACVDLPSYIDYQILFTPREIEQGQPVLREFLDFKARTEKEEFQKAKEEGVNHEEYDFSATGVDGSLVLDRAMKECEIFLKKKEKILLKISQLEAELETRKKNFDMVQKEYQTKIQTSKENIDRLRQMQEETTNRIESNYYRKQQMQEIGKQEQLEQEFEQQRTRYLLEKNEGEEEIAKFNAQMDANKKEVEFAMQSEYKTFFNKFCQSAEKVVAKSFSDKFAALHDESEQDKDYITQLEIKLKNKPDDLAAGTFDAPEGHYDEKGNYVYTDGTFYDTDGLYHDLQGNIYTQDGQIVSRAPEKQPQEKEVVNFDDFDDFDFMTDVSAKGDVYDVAEKVIEDVDKNVEVVNNKSSKPAQEEQSQEAVPEDSAFKDADAQEQKETDGNAQAAELESFSLDNVKEKKSEPDLAGEQPSETPVETSSEEQIETTSEIPSEENLENQSESATESEPNAQAMVMQKATTKPSKPRGRPRKAVPAKNGPAKKRGRPRKTMEPAQITEPKRKAGRPRKATAAQPAENTTVTAAKKKVGRPRKTTAAAPVRSQKNKRGR